MNNKIWLSSPHMGGSELKYIHEAFASNLILPFGNNVDTFEDSLEDYLFEGINEKVYVAAVSSGTAAIHLGLLLLGVGKGDEVLIQSHTHIASANPILYLNAVPVFIDSETDTLNICPITLENAIKDRISKGKKPKAIVAVHLYGNPYKVDEVRDVANRYGIPILEDGAESLGSQYKGKYCGVFGDISAISFNGNKIITTSGGGAIVLPTKELKEKTVFLATQARDKAPYYQHSTIGYNYRISNICAGIGRGQMEVLQQHIVLRQNVHEFYKTVFEEIEGVTVFSMQDEDYVSNCWLTVILMDLEVVGKTPEDLRVFLEKDTIESRHLWKPMHLQPLYQEFEYYGNNVCEQLFLSGLCLPSGSNLTEEDKKRIKISLHNFFNLNAMNSYEI